MLIQLELFDHIQHRWLLLIIPCYNLISLAFVAVRNRLHWNEISLPVLDT